MKNLKAACLVAACLAMAWNAVPARADVPATQVTLITNLNRSLSNAYFFLYVNNGSSGDFSIPYSIGSVPAGPDQMTVFNVDPSGNNIAGYSFAGEYDTTNSLVTVGMFPASAFNTVGSSATFASAFNSSESAFATALTTNDTTTLKNFADAHDFQLESHFGLNDSQFEFSQAVTFSTAAIDSPANAIISAVPEPASITGLGAGLTMLLLCRRRTADAIA